MKIILLIALQISLGHGTNVGSGVTIGSSTPSTPSLLRNATPSSFSTPSGYTLLAEEDFDGNSNGQLTCSGGSTSASIFHTSVGSHSHKGIVDSDIGSTPSGGGTACYWPALPSGHHEVYMSFYEYFDGGGMGIANEMFEGEVYGSDGGVGMNTPDWVVDFYCPMVAGSCGGPNGTSLWWNPYGHLQTTIQSFNDTKIFFYGTQHPDSQNVWDTIGYDATWRQWEIHIKAPTSGNSDGLIEMWRDGVLMGRSVNFSAGNNPHTFDQMNGRIGGTYSGNIFRLPDLSKIGTNTPGYGNSDGCEQPKYFSSGQVSDQATSLATGTTTWNTSCSTAGNLGSGSCPGYGGCYDWSQTCQCTGAGQQVDGAGNQRRPFGRYFDDVLIFYK